MTKQKPLENQTLEELKANKAKTQKILYGLLGFYSFFICFMVYTVFETKNWALLGTLALITTVLPIFVIVQNLDKEIKKREQIF
jgi:hypothetical protein